MPPKSDRMITLLSDARQLLHVVHAAAEAAVAEQIVLDIRHVERRHFLAAPARSPWPMAAERRRSAEIAHHRHDLVLRFEPFTN